ncbi:MAG: LCP family protein [Anaerolineaceae bacterium]|nr:LCP family protein [Anaerolineaceae bacterium]
MRKINQSLLSQIFTLTVCGLVLIIDLLLIHAAGTVFRSQIPFFQLADRQDENVVGMEVGPEPAAFPGVVDLTPSPATRLYMILGSDFRPESGYRTDVIMLVAVDSLSGKVSLVSFPRDLWVTIPGYFEERINAVMQVGGFQLLANTMQTNFGIYPTDYVLVDMEGFLDTVDVLGGVTFETDFQTADACDSSLDPDRWCEVGPGKVTLDQDWALWYVRARYNSSDFDRLRRTQEVVQAVAKKVISPAGWLKWPALMDVYASDVESSLSPDELLPFIRFAFGFNPDEDIRHYSIGPNEAVGYTTAGGAQVLLPNIPLIQTILQQAITFE